MKLKQLEEKRAELLAQIEEENKSETRSIEKIDEMLKEVDEVNAQITKEKEIEARLLDLNNGGKKVEKKIEKRDFNAEIRAAIANEKELDVTNFEVEERTHGLGIGAQAGAVTQTIGNIKKTTFANAILKKAAESSDLYKYVRRENLGSALHQIPVQKTKITKFANVAELAEYAQKNIDFDTVQLAAHKYGNISIVSEEAISDLGYDIMAELVEQYGEAAGAKIDELLVKGDTTGGINVQGLESFINPVNGNAADNTETKVVKITEANTQDQETLINGLIELYNALPRKYAKNATWVISNSIASKLNAATDGVGRPLMSMDFSQVPFGGQAIPMLLGRPVVINDEVKSLADAAQHNPIAFFGDLNKALIMGIRQNFTLKSSTEYMWVRDGVAIKGTMRLDAKRGITEAMAALVRQD